MALTLRLAAVAPPTGLKLVPPGASTYHWTVGAGAPVAADVNVTEPLATTDWLSGLRVMVGVVALVREKLSAAVAPAAAAVTVYGPPAVALAVTLTLAEPLAATGAGLADVKAALAPEPGAVKLTRPPATGSPSLFGVTVTVSGLGKSVPGW